MTSSNVSNLLVQGLIPGNDMTPNINPKGTGDKLFEQTLKSVASPSDSPDFNVQRQNDNPKDRQSDPVEFVKSKQTENRAINKAEDEPKDVRVEEISDKVDKITDAVKEVVKEELGIDDEQLDEAMEMLGLTAIDLLNPQNLAQLVLTLTEETDSVTLIVSDDFKNILDEVMGLANQLLEENGISPAEVREIFATDPGEMNFIPNDVEMPYQNQEMKPGDIPSPEISDEIISKDIEDVPRPESFAAVEKPLDMAKPDSTIDEKLQPLTEEDNNLTPVVQTDNSPKEDTTNEQFDFKGNSKQMTFKAEVATEARTENVFVAEQKFELSFSPVDETVSLPIGQTVTTQEIVNQFIEAARVMSTAESTTMEMTLNPEGLGKIFMEVTQKGEEITARIFTENDAVKQALESQMANLRTELNNSSQKVTSIEVSVASHEFERNLEEGQEQSNRQQENNQPKRRPTRIDLNNLDDLAGPMTEEEMLVAQIMKDNGNTLNYQA